MSSDPKLVFTRAFGLRIALWYATLFVLGAIAIVFLTYYLTKVSLEQRDHQILQSKLGDYVGAYSRGGINTLAATVRAEQQAAPERLFVRVVNRGVEAIVLSSPNGWDPTTIETAAVSLPDGTLVQVGKSADAREDLLARFRAALGLVTLLVVVIALSGGWLVTQSAVTPIRRLTAAVRRIIRTGRTDARVPVEGTPGSTDAIGELIELFNVMLDKIEGVVAAMRGALDNVSHDLRTPLTRLRGTAELALASPPDLERYREALVLCVEESDRVLVMLNTLMDISEAESGAMQLRREPVRLSEIVERAVDLYKDVADAKGVTLSIAPSPAATTPVPSGSSLTSAPVASGSSRTSAPVASGSSRTSAPVASGFSRTSADTDVVVDADRTRLEQVAANLIDNAVKYTPPGGRVDVEVRRENGNAVLRVRDTGPGIPPDELPRIWTRLFRGDASRAERGLGLGLSLVKAIVEAHGGTVAVESEPGKGSTFTVSLPLG
jgi:signal transduction histidine kinase